LYNLATEFHKYYNKGKIIDENDSARTATRIYLITAVQLVLNDGLNLLGISSPEKM